MTGKYIDKDKSNLRSNASNLYLPSIDFWSQVACQTQNLCFIFSSLGTQCVCVSRHFSVIVFVIKHRVLLASLLNSSTAKAKRFSPSSCVVLEKAAQKIFPDTFRWGLERNKLQHNRFD